MMSRNPIPEPRTPRFCPQCGQRIASHSDRISCSACGRVVHRPLPSPPPPPPTETTTRGPRVPDPPPPPPNLHLRIGVPGVWLVVLSVLAIVNFIMALVYRMRS